HAARFPHPELSDDHRGAVRHDEGDPVALHASARREPRGEGIAEPVQLPVGQPGALEDRRRVAWPFGGGVPHDVHQGLLRVRRQGRRHSGVVVLEPGPRHTGVCRRRAGSASRGPRHSYRSDSTGSTAAAPRARLMPISWVRSLTTTYMMLATPTPAMSSVKAPTSPMKIWMPSPTAWVSFSSSMKSHMPRARSSVGSKRYFRPKTR